MWKKRQAVYSDQGSYRNYSKPSLLWNTIDKNTRLGGASPNEGGHITGLKFEIHTTASYTLTAGTESTIWVSDPSNISLTDTVNPASDDIRNDSADADDNMTTVSPGARGLVFSTRCKIGLSGAQTKKDIINMQYNIENGGYGYKVGDFIIVKSSQLGATGGVDNLVKITVVSVV
tara:strand:+ start:2616 stop:3140 length:525 start_codon:yes stop_codon:yes gene_type:complete